VKDAHTDLAKTDIKLSIDGRQITTFAYNQVTDRLSYTPGRKLASRGHTVRVNATDSAGNHAAKQWRFKLLRWAGLSRDSNHLRSQGVRLWAAPERNDLLVTASLTGVAIEGSAPDYDVQPFSNAKVEDEGKKLLGSKAVSTDGSGNFSFVFRPEKSVAAGKTMTATAGQFLTAVTRDTSEFSAPKKVVLS
jgi:hypothetical protein